MISGKQINDVLVMVRDMAPDNGDAQLTILARAFVIGCRSCQIDKGHALQIVGQLFDEGVTLTALSQTTGAIQ